MHLSSIINSKIIFMRTLIVPVDFSRCSLNAVNYALSFAYKVKADITLLHVCQVPVAVSEAPVMSATYNAVIEDAEKKILEWKRDLEHKSAGKVRIFTEIREGYLVTQLQDTCKRLNPYAVIMGGGEKSAMERVIFGSNVVSVMKHILYPLIIVPAGALFTAIDKIGLACDLRNVADTVHAEQVKKIVQDFKAQVHILHVNGEPGKMIGDQEIEGSEWLRDLFMDLKPEFHFLNNENMDDAINVFAEKNNFDMLIIIPKKHGLLEDVFHKSHTKKITLHSHLPVLSIHE